jgi:hypothetical protein
MQVRDCLTDEFAINEKEAKSRIRSSTSAKFGGAVSFPLLRNAPH